MSYNMHCHRQFLVEDAAASLFIWCMRYANNLHNFARSVENLLILFLQDLGYFAVCLCVYMCVVWVCSVVCVCVGVRCVCVCICVHVSECVFVYLSAFA